MHVLKVALPLPLEPMSYLPPHGGEGAALGHRVVVPWRGELRVGVVVGLEEGERKGFALREAVAYLEAKPWLRPEEIAFLQATAHDSFSPLGSLLGDLIPFLEPPLEHRVRLLPGAAPSLLPRGMEALLDWQTARGFDPKLLDYLREAGVLEETVAERRTVRRVLVPRRPPDPSLGPKARAALETLIELGGSQSLTELAQAAGVGMGAVKALVEQGFAEWVEPELEAPPRPAPLLGGLELDPFPPRLEGGRLAERIRAILGLARRERLLVLFPEVWLLQHFAQHLPQAVRFHGEMKPQERRKIWERLGAEPPPELVLATYQGLLLPFTPDRVVVVEESSEAYKLSAGSRAFVPRLAALRARMLSRPISYVSQVSSVEVWDQASHTLPTAKPRLYLLDMRQEQGWPLCGAAVALLRQVAEKGRQAIVLSNRRGYSALLRCQRCEWKAMCPNCALPLRYHKGGRTGLLQCHQCGYEEKAPLLCPNCQADVFDPKGPGVEWLLESLAAWVPELPRYRYTAQAKDDLDKLLLGEPGVLVGTTALLRGPTLPELALVLLPYADGFVLESDFRASERYHRLLWSLTDLHPRRKPLLALQTFEPGQAAHKALETADATGFMEFEWALRHSLGYPPATRMVKLEVSHSKEPVARDAAERLAEVLRAKAQPGELLGPAPAPIARVRNQYVFHLLLKAGEARLNELMAGLPPVRGAKLRLDPDPQSFVGLLED
ncbi:MAG: primosomal protein N' [Thermaceae bacterium]|nr:primosomal protein N' [Thermaceae bacterium]